MERDDRAVATFYVETTPAEGRVSVLDERAAHHVRVRRLAEGARIRVTDGAGTLGLGSIGLIRKSAIEVLIERTRTVAPAAPIHLFVPVGDRDRMLWLAEKATELAVTSWQAVRFHRSASVTSRGEGSAFASKVRARMISALEQSAGAWLPDIRSDATFDDVRLPSDTLGLLLDAEGAPLLSYASLAVRSPVALVFGPEGGLEAAERSRLSDCGWRMASLGGTTLRFETAGIAACAIVRAMTSAKE